MSLEQETAKLKIDSEGGKDATTPEVEQSAQGQQQQQQQPGSGSESKEPSASALKKLAKAKEKEEKKAAKKREVEQRQQQQQQAAAVDFAQENYGPLPAADKRASQIDSLENVSEDAVITVQARVQNIRAQTAKLVFLLLREGRFTIQAVVAAGDEKSSVSRQMAKWTASLNAETIVELTGIVKKPVEPVNSASISAFEIHVQKIYILSNAVAQFPMQLESALLPELKDEEEQQQQVGADGKALKTPKVSLKTRLDNRVVDLRTPTNSAILWIKHGVSELFQEYLRKNGFVQIFTPKLMAAASEGGSSVFAVKYFERMAFLAQSPQLHKQMAIGGDCGRVYEIGPVFRAENSNSHRHMTEFIGLDLEMTFKKDYGEVLDLLEGLFVYIFNGLKERYGKEIETVRKQYPAEEFKVPETGKMLRLTFAQGIAMLREAGVEADDYEDLSTANERHLGKLVKEKYDTDFFILDKFPLAVRPFYTMPAPEDNRLSNSYDFFMRGEEIMSGAQRVHQHDLLIERMKALGVDPESEGLKDYVDSFKYATAPHAGGGIGLERVVFLYLGLGNIRKASTWPRDPQRLRP
ncbi:MAG: hypothetical protein M1825_003939 [Sarcosagium campestre]|nr:MAG: hypothetical protein M1825_003939 [Sarcosagium campestre]